jgi:hypothetical protein
MATLSTNNPTLADVAKRLDPDGSIARVAEILHQFNEILDDIPWVEGNLPTGHRTTIRSGLPGVTWRKLYGGVQPTKSTTVQVNDTTGMLEAYAEIDKALADLNGNTAAYRLSEETPFMESLAQQVAQTIFYGNEGTQPEAFTGLAPRYNTLGTNSTPQNSSDNVISAGGSGSTNTSIWFVLWGEQTMHGIYPKGSKAGLAMNDKGQVTIENADGAGGRMEAYRTHYRWDCGISVRDWRYAVRICNVDVTALTKDYSTGADLVDLIVQAFERVPSLKMGRPALYCNRTIKSYLRRQMVNHKNVLVRPDEVTGKHVLYVDEVPVRRVDQLVNTEAAVS